MIKERRSSKRISTDFDAVIKKKTSAEEPPPELSSRVRNVSTGGLFLKTEYSLSAEDRVRLSFELPGIGEPVEVEGVVRWSRRSGKEKGLGIEFTDVDPSEHDKIKEYAVKKLQKHGLDNLTETKAHRELLMFHGDHVEEEMSEEDLFEQLEIEEEGALKNAIEDFLDAGLLGISGNDIVFRSLEDMHIAPAVKEWRDLQKNQT